MLERINKL